MERDADHLPHLSLRLRIGGASIHYPYTPSRRGQGRFNIIFLHNHAVTNYVAGPSSRAVLDVGLRLLACSDLGSNPTGDMDFCLL